MHDSIFEILELANHDMEHESGLEFPHSWDAVVTIDRQGNPHIAWSLVNNSTGELYPIGAYGGRVAADDNNFTDRFFQAHQAAFGDIVESEGLDLQEEYERWENKAQRMLIQGALQGKGRPIAPPPPELSRGGAPSVSGRIPPPRPAEVAGFGGRMAAIPPDVRYPQNYTVRPNEATHWQNESRLPDGRPPFMSQLPPREVGRPDRAAGLDHDPRDMPSGMERIPMPPYGATETPGYHVKRVESPIAAPGPWRPRTEEEEKEIAKERRKNPFTEDHKETRWFGWRKEGTRGEPTKFWTIRMQGSKHAITAGKVGKEGTTKTRDFASPNRQVRAADIAMAKMQAKGYYEIARKMMIDPSEITSFAQQQAAQEKQAVATYSSRAVDYVPPAGVGRQEQYPQEALPRVEAQPWKSLPMEAKHSIRRFEYKAGTSKKFWEVKRSTGKRSTRYTVKWGRLGTEGQTKTFTLPTFSAMAKAVEKAIQSKIDKGYKEVGAS